MTEANKEDQAADLQGMHVGYVSSYDTSSASGFIRRDDNPQRLVSFRQSDIGDDREHILPIGQEVQFQIDEEHSGQGDRRWDVATRVQIIWPDDGARLDGSLDESLPSHVKG